MSGKPAGMTDRISGENVVMFTWVVGMHLLCLSAFFVGVSWVAVITTLVLWQVGIFFIGAGYHRYFAHKSYKTSRVFQTILAVGAVLQIQGGVRKWAQDHRHHHRYSDEPEDVHSPYFPSFFWAHMGWVLTLFERDVKKAGVKDLDAQPELVWVDRLMALLIVALAGGLYAFGEALGPAYGTSGLQMVVWGFVIRTVLIWHTTWTINSVSHVVGGRRFPTRDSSRNNWFIAMITGGEGYHNNHHANPSLACQGLFWWEWDSTFWILKALSRIGVVRELRQPDAELKAVARSLTRMHRRGWRVLGGTTPSRKEARERLNELIQATTERIGELRAEMKKKQAQLSAQAEALGKSELAARYNELREAFRRKLLEIEQHFGVELQTVAA